MATYQFPDSLVAYLEARLILAAELVLFGFGVKRLPEEFETVQGHSEISRGRRVHASDALRLENADVVRLFDRVSFVCGPACRSSGRLRRQTLQQMREA